MKDNTSSNNIQYMLEIHICAFQQTSPSALEPAQTLMTLPNLI